MFGDLDSLNLILLVCLKNTVVDECVLLAALCIVYADDERVVLSDVLGQTEGAKVVHVELNLSCVNLLAHTGVEANLLDVVRLVGSEKPTAGCMLEQADLLLTS